jgi:hypothetical protein
VLLGERFWKKALFNWSFWAIFLCHFFKKINQNDTRCVSRAQKRFKNAFLIAQSSVFARGHPLLARGEFYKILWILVTLSPLA